MNLRRILVVFLSVGPSGAGPLACDAPADAPAATTVPAAPPIASAQPRPTSRAVVAAAPVRAADLLDLLPQTLAGLGQLDRRLKQHAPGTPGVWESKSNYGAFNATQSGAVGIFDYGVGSDGEREWVPVADGMPVWPYQGEITAEEETVADRPARLLSPDVFEARRLIVRANSRFDVVFALRPEGAGAASGKPVDPEVLRNAASKFDWARLDALRDVPANYAVGVSR